MDEMPAWAARMDAKLDMLVDAKADVEKRVRSLEGEKWLHRGGIAVVSFLLYRMGFPSWFHS